MTLKEFIKLYDKQNSIVLLEGKRDVLDADCAKLTSLGKLLASKTKKIMFRSGNASGSDYYFSLGVSMVNPMRLHVITPYAGHRKVQNKAYETISLDNIPIAANSEVIYQSKQNKKFEKLIDQYVDGNINHSSIKAAYIIRDTIKAIGTDDIRPATFGIFYDNPANPKTGGTGHTMNVCLQNNIPIVDQSVWFNWLNE